MQDINFIVDETKCIKCGLCVKDCITGAISIKDNETPKAENPDNCLKCQHCLAICPVGAISIFGKKPEDSSQIYTQNPDMILNLIKSRRSNRQFKAKNVDKEILNKLKNMLKWVPTGCNAHSTYISFIDDIDVMNEFRDYTNKKVINIIKNKGLRVILDTFASYLNAFLNGDDIIFRGAPHLVVVSNKITAPCAKEDAIITLSYFELYAQSLGLGTCWCGYADACIKAMPELCSYLKIPDGYKPEYVMLFGERDINYARTVQPEEIPIISAEKAGINKLKFTEKLKRYFWNFIR